MQLNRRGFLSSLIGTAALDPERLMWVPGKLISIPKEMPLPGAVIHIPSAGAWQSRIPQIMATVETIRAGREFAEWDGISIVCPRDVNGVLLPELSMVLMPKGKKHNGEFVNIDGFEHIHLFKPMNGPEVGVRAGELANA